MRTFVEDDPVGNWKSQRQGKCLFLGTEGLVFFFFCFVFVSVFFLGGGRGGGSCYFSLVFDTCLLLFLW